MLVKLFYFCIVLYGVFAFIAKTLVNFLFIQLKFQ